MTQYSYRLREVIKDEEINDLLKTDHTLKWIIITDAHDMISKLKNSVRTVYYENMSLKNQLKVAKRSAFELFNLQNKLVESYNEV